MKKVFYTAIIGNYDRLNPVPEKFREGWDLRCFSDQDLGFTCWRILPVNRGELPAVALARRIKILSHAYVPDADLSVWLDASRELKVPLDEIAASLGDSNVLFFRHPERSCVYDEFGACLRTRRIDPKKAALQRRQYGRMRVPRGMGLQGTAMIVRRKSAETEKLMTAWWELTKEYGTWRDQLTLPVALWKLKYRPRQLPYSVFKKFCEAKVLHKGIYAGKY